MVKKTTLANGLRLVAVPVKNSKSVTVLVLVGTGSKYETKDINGISHFLEHMFFKGTKKRPTTLKISETLDMIGGQYNAFTSKEVTGFWAKVDKRHQSVALDWISDMFLHSTFSAEEIEREKGVVIEELNMYLDTPTSYVSELFDQLLYGDQPAGWRIVGEKENILGYNQKKLLDYYRSHYATNNTVICIAGDINAKKMAQDVKYYFGKAAMGDSMPKIPTSQVQVKPQVLVHYKKTDQTHFCLGVRAYDITDPRRYALSILSTVLGGNMSSRLFISVRERNGLGYYVHTSVDSTSDTGYLVTQAGIKNSSLAQAVGLVLAEYTNIKEKGITQKELKKAKDYLRGTMALSLDSTDAQASFYATQEVMQEQMLTPEQKMEMIDKVSLGDIKKVAKEIFSDNRLNLSIIGPLEQGDIKQYESLLKL